VEGCACAGSAGAATNPHSQNETHSRGANLINPV